MINDQTHPYVYKGLADRKEKVFIVRDEAPYFSEALGFSLPSLLVNSALVRLVSNLVHLGLQAAFI